MVLTSDQLKLIAPYAVKSKIDALIIPLNDTLKKYEINSTIRVCHFLAQVLHESGAFRYMEEIASGSAYEGRRDLGNIINGDGKRFKGRGLIQLTGRANYEKYSKEVGEQIMQRPELVATPKYCVDVAGWFWKIKSLNNLADQLVTDKLTDTDIVKQVTKKVNGGYNGLDDRLQYFKKAKEVLSKSIV